jgi:DNA-binding winged helix-turn-helix (wHTH) protein
VWLPGGRTVELATRPLLCRILLSIAARGGRATKEEIVLFAWEQRDYHSIRDDKRLQVAVRKLRLLLEDDPSRAARLVTTPEGYAFGDSEPFRLLASGEEESPPRTVRSASSS